MQVSPMIQASRENKIGRMMQATGCTRDYAIAYLMAEEWFVRDAIESYTIDQQLKGITP
jgi:hypothetical protein